MPDRPSQPPVQSPVSSRDSRSRFADLLRRAEEGKRTRLTRRGKPIAYLVPLEDVERLKRLEWLEEREARAAGVTRDPFPEAETGYGYTEPAYEEPAGQEPAYDEPATASEQVPRPFRRAPAERMGALKHGRIDVHNDEQRESAAQAFKKGFHRILASSESLSRADVSKRLPKDGYISSTVLSIIGEG